MNLRLFILSCASLPLVPAQDQPAAGQAPPPAPTPAPATAAAKPQLERLDATRYRIGQVVIDSKTREIRFPTKVNMAAGLLEYLVVKQQGKVHESLLITAISPIHLSLAFALLRYPASTELFAILDDTGHPSGEYPLVPLAVKVGARIVIDVEWKDADGKIRRNPVNDWIRHTDQDTPMPAGPWLYTGSGVSQDKFIPELTGDIAAIFIAPAAMINYPGNDREDDTVWFAHSTRVPPKDTEVTVIITPFAKPAPLPKP